MKKNKDTKAIRITGSRQPRFRHGLLACPGDIIGWIRIPAVLMFFVGILGLVKHYTLLASPVLKQIHFPSPQWCITLTLFSLSFYLFCVLRRIYLKIYPPHSEIYDRPVIPQSWRSF